MSYGFEKTVLDMHSPYYTLPCQIGNVGLEADEQGKKIIKAGTPVGGATNALLTRDTVLQSTNTPSNGSQAQGVLIHDVDVTAGAVTGTVAFMGVIDLAKSEVKKIDTTVNLPRIIFMKGRAF